MEGLERGDTKPFYGYVKSQQQDSQGVSPLRAHGQLFSDAASEARMLSEQFKSVFTKDDPTAPTILPDSQAHTFPTFRQSPWSRMEWRSCF